MSGFWLLYEMSFVRIAVVPSFWYMLKGGFQNHTAFCIQVILQLLNFETLKYYEWLNLPFLNLTL